MLQQKLKELTKETHDSKTGTTNIELKIKERNEEVTTLKEILNNTEQRQRELEEENEELKERIKSMEDEYEKLMTEANEEPINQKKLNKELSSVYNDILNLSKAITGIIKGEEPNIQSLWGISNSDKSIEIEEVNGEELESLKLAVDSIRTNICDYYADKYSNECNLQ